MKTVKQIINGHATNVGTIKVQELLPAEQFENPFLLFHHGIAVADKQVPIPQQGVGPHPHRGFSAISFIYKGGVHHRDSRGNNHVVYAGGTQWIHAGMGIIHSERVPADIFEIGGVQELLQVWVNTPAAHKMDQPHYYPATAAQTPTVVSPDGLITLRVPSGELNGVKGIIPTFTKVTTIMGEAKKGGQFEFSFPSAYQTILYVLEGSITINGKDQTNAKQMALFNKDGENFSITANEETLFFVGSGEPMQEPIAAHGPFVMNNQTEIMQAFRDYQLGKMGVLIEE
ncbi:MAG: pirin family protein [Sphingobacteriia bacterium]|nr:pirin family protein [Sphingobacteriia bacterium]